MTEIEQDIRSIPEILRQTHARIEERRDVLAPLLQGPIVLLGSGSSYCVAQSLAVLYEQECAAPGQAIIPSDYFSRPTWTHIAISRTGETTELIDALRRAHEAGGYCILLTGQLGSPAEAYADTVVALEFAAEQGVIQTRFIIAATEAMRMLIAGAAGYSYSTMNALPDLMQQAIASFDASSLLSFDHIVYLGRDWRYGLARAAALNLQETALLVPEAHQTLDYRHGPIACADTRTLVWCFDPFEDTAASAVIDDIRRTGATVVWSNVDPLIAVAQTQLFAVQKAARQGVNPAAPRNLRRAIIL